MRCKIWRGFAGVWGILPANNEGIKSSGKICENKNMRLRKQAQKPLLPRSGLFVWCKEAYLRATKIAR